MLRERFASILDDRKKKKGLFTLGIALAVIIGAGMIITFENKQEAVETDNIVTISEANDEIHQDNNNSASDDTKVIEIKGCSIKVPESWEVTNGESDIFYLEAEGHRIGGIKLMEDSSKTVQLGNVFELPVNEEKPNVILDQGEEGYMTIDYTAFSDAPYMQYVFMDLSNPPPYAYEIYFDTTYVDRETITMVLGTFREPELQVNAPEKIRKALTQEEAKKTATYKVLREDGQEETFNIQKLEAFIKAMQQGQAGSVEIIQYIEAEGKAVISDWSVLTFDGKIGSCYGYYALENGEYTYDNIPVTFTTITKKIYEDVVDYRLDGSMRLFQMEEKPELLTMTAKEDKLYTAYKQDLEDRHLKGLEPMTIAKFYLLACIENENDVRYALYEPYEEGQWGWSKEEDEKYSQEESKLSTYERIKDIRNLVNGTFVLQDARHGYIAYENYDANGNAVAMGFQMIKTSDDIWKVCFTPIQ